MTSKGELNAVRYCDFDWLTGLRRNAMNNIIWWVGFIVILLAVLSFLGLR
ncbi:hypothetical protein SAMN06298226_0186 [Nitrosovibrio sp. Nv4]|nr:hypothetical protein SAMN06298226_0186 [Nitrosovibrio sp. Nv4]